MRVRHYNTLLLPSLSFTTQASYAGKTVDLNTFQKYVARTVTIPSGVDSSKITTAVVAEDGAQRHVPTRVYLSQGTWYAEINSLTNSVYALISNEQHFADAAGKWYEGAVNEMAGREIVGGRDSDTFDGDASITRAEFPAILVRALGLPANGTSAFRDVSSTDWFCGAVGAAYSYGLVNGRDASSFDPNANISRQEAMSMMQRAAKVAEFPGTSGTLTEFSDASAVSGCALEAAQFNVGSGLIVGSNGQLKPISKITRAESATVILRLLQKAGLVDIRTQI